MYRHAMIASTGVTGLVSTDRAGSVVVAAWTGASSGAALGAASGPAMISSPGSVGRSPLARRSGDTAGTTGDGTACGSGIVATRSGGIGVRAAAGGSSMGVGTASTEGAALRCTLSTTGAALRCTLSAVRGGRGGFGFVYRAEMTSGKKTVALKVVKQEES